MPQQNKPALILASRSPYRRQLLARAGLEARSVPADIDERPQEGEPPRDTALRLAVAKAAAIASPGENSLIIGSDQLAELDGQHLGKPHTMERAQAQLRACAGKRVVFHTALCLLNSATGKQRSCVETVTVQFRPLSEANISAYLRKEDVLDCAGSFKCEGLGICLFEAIHSRDPSTLQGLPLIQLISFLAEENYPILD